MNRLLDLRFVIGVFFLVVGILLLIEGFVHSQNGLEDINRWCGGIFCVFGIVMIVLSSSKSAGDELVDDNSELLEGFPEKL